MVHIRGGTRLKQTEMLLQVHSIHFSTCNNVNKKEIKPCCEFTSRNVSFSSENLTCTISAWASKSYSLWLVSFIKIVVVKIRSTNSFTVWF